MVHDGPSGTKLPRADEREAEDNVELSLQTVTMAGSPELSDDPEVLVVNGVSRSGGIQGKSYQLHATDAGMSPAKSVTIQLAEGMRQAGKLLTAGVIVDDKYTNGVHVTIGE